MIDIEKKYTIKDTDNFHKYMEEMARKHNLKEYHEDIMELVDEGFYELEKKTNTLYPLDRVDFYLRIVKRYSKDASNAKVILKLIEAFPAWNRQRKIKMIK